MHRALIYLHALRARALARQIFRSMKTLRGLLFGAVTLGVFAVWLGATFLSSGDISIDLDILRDLLPLSLFAVFVMQLTATSNDRSLAFSPAEVNFLFQAPFTRRDVLLYKIAAGFGGAATLSVVFTFLILRSFQLSWVAVYLGIFLALGFILLFNMAIALLAQTLAARALGQVRWAVRIALGCAALLTIIYVNLPETAYEWSTLLERTTGSPWYRYGLAPFRLSALIIVTPSCTLSTVGWILLSCLMNAAVLLLIIGLDADFLEASLATSQKLYERISRFQRGAPIQLTKSGMERIRIPLLPRFAGAGTIAYRQMLSALRMTGTLILLVGTTGAGIFVGLLLRQFDVADRFNAAVVIILGINCYMTLLFSTILRLDFRSELDYMERLKTLPIASMAVAAGELGVPILMATLYQILFTGIVLAVLQLASILPILLIFAIPLNALFFAVENLFFLLFPSRITPGVIDIQFMGKRVLIFVAESMVVGASILWAAGVGGLSVYLGLHWVAAACISWVLLVFCAAAICALVAWAFERFDPSLHTPV